MKPNKKEYIDAAIKRIEDWCKSTDSRIADIVWVAIRVELETMLDVGISNGHLPLQK